MEGLTADLVEKMDELDRQEDRPSIEPGDYDFKVYYVEEATFRSGNQGLKLRLLVAAGKSEVKSFDNIIFTQNAIWKLSALKKAVGCAVKNSELKPWDIEGKTGRAEFVLNDRGYLSVGSYIENAEKSTEDDLPF